MKFKVKKTAIVTGAASGIGFEIATQLADLGYEVHGIDIRLIDAGSVTGHICDVSKAEDVSRTILEIVGVDSSRIPDLEQVHLSPEEEAVFEPRIDFLINVAGIITRGRYPFYLTPLSDWKHVMDVNLNGTFYVSKYTLPWMRENGCVINFSTEQVKIPNLKSAPYAVSKAGIEMLTRIMATSLLERKIRVNTVALASVRTSFIRHLVQSEAQLEEKMERADKSMPFGIIEMEDVWKTVRYLLFDAPKTTGQTILIESGMTQ